MKNAKGLCKIQTISQWRFMIFNYGISTLHTSLFLNFEDYSIKFKQFTLTCIACIRLYEYIHGGNLNSSHILMTAPVLTSINSSSSSRSDYFVRFYIPAKYGGNPPQPNPELNVQLVKWKSHCIAVRKFTGFANDDDNNKEIEALVNSLNKNKTGKAAILEDKSYYSVAQYNASYHLSGRLNEVWINVSGFTAEGCPNYQGNY